MSCPVLSHPVLLHPIPNPWARRAQLQFSKQPQATEPQVPSRVPPPAGGRGQLCHLPLIPPSPLLLFVPDGDGWRQPQGCALQVGAAPQSGALSPAVSPACGARCRCQPFSWGPEHGPVWLRLPPGLLCQGMGWLRQRGGTRDSSPVTLSPSQNQHPVLSTQTVPRSCPRALQAAHPSMGPPPRQSLVPSSCLRWGGHGGGRELVGTTGTQRGTSSKRWGEQSRQEPNGENETKRRELLKN